MDCDQAKLSSTPKWLPALLEKESFLHWHAFFNVYFHNHKAQGAIALARIGASEERIKERFNYTNNGGIMSFADQPKLTQRTEVDSLKSEKITDYLGAHVGYYKILDYFTKLYKSKYNKDLEKFIRDELSPVIDGQIGSLFHGIIQTGYGYAAGCDQVVLEGVALSYHSYSPVKSSTNPERSRDISRFGKGSTDILDVVKHVKENPSAGRNTSSICDKYSDDFLDYTDKIKLPDFFVSGEEDMDQVIKLMDWILDMAAVVYVKCDYVNDFYLLHGITGAWALLQVLDLLDYKTAVAAARAHLAALLVTVASVNPPGMSKRPEDYWKGNTVDQEAWDILLQKLLNKDYEAHVHKVVQCLYEAWKKNPNGPNASYQIAASKLIVDQRGYHF